VVEEPVEEAVWPGFRGSHRDGVNPAARIATDWSTSPPKQIWSRDVGPGWSSFAVDGDLLYTQEQRGPDEVVSCYRVSTGEPVWAHKDQARFWESNAGAGPRGTPTVYGRQVYALGGTGILNALDAKTGRVLWTRNAASDAHAKTPEWGFAGSPLVLDDAVIVAASGQLIGYDRRTGAVRWLGPKHGTSYSSPHLASFGGKPQVLQLSSFGATSVDPATGKAVWEHEWKGYPIVQPALTADGDVLIAVNESSGIRRLSVSGPAGGSTWSLQERWTSTGLKPYFNDFIVHKGYAYGFDGAILSCIDLQDGKRRWKGGRYGHGQVLLLAAQDLLLVLAEEGDLALVKAAPDGYTEVAKIQALEGKTWNHPVIAGEVLLVRNGEHMAAFRLTSLPVSAESR
jgi:outer membrane protein assembly factor BamB